MAGVNGFPAFSPTRLFGACCSKNGHALGKPRSQRANGWSRRCDGVSRHMPRFRAHGKTGPATKSRLVIGTALSAELLPEEIGRLAMFRRSPEPFRRRLKDAGIFRYRRTSTSPDQNDRC